MNKWVIPKVFGDYVIGERILETTNCVLHFAFKSNCKYIIKFSRFGNIEKEFILMKKIHHPNILQVYDLYTSCDIKGYSMPIAHGRDLHLYITTLFNSKRYLFEEKIRDIIKQLLEALAYIHELHIIHRDVTPENIFFLDDQKTQICLADFGLSSEIENLTGYIGTPAYMAPEIHLKQPCLLTKEISNFQRSNISLLTVYFEN